MLETLRARDGLYFASFLYRRDLFGEEQLHELWAQKFPGPSFTCWAGPSTMAQYYSKEMGRAENLDRVIIVSSRPRSREELVEHKYWAMEMERAHCHKERRRQINIDIGLLTEENVVLSTTKAFGHRPYLGKNIYAELTYRYEKGQYHALAWSYPDYQNEKVKEFFSWVREVLKSTIDVTAKNC